jgi:hypothetical protein
MTTEVDSKRFEEFTQKLRDLELKTRTVPLETLTKVFMQVFAHRPGIPVRRDWTLEALRFAERNGAIRFPSANGIQWDHGNPRLPKRVTRIFLTPADKDRWWRDHYWHPKLEWVADVPDLSLEDGAFLLKVQRGFVEHWFNALADIKYRSIQLTGHEKRLNKLFERKTLFGSGKLEIADLNTNSDILPLAYKVVGTRARAIVFENKGSYNVAIATLKKLGLSKSPYGIIAFGGGSSFVDAVRDFQNIQVDTNFLLSQIEYVGDLDWKGIAIAQSAHHKTQKYGLPPLIPAVGVHAAMLQALLEPSIHALDGFPGNQLKTVPAALEWLPQEVRTEVKRIFDKGNRIPEEMLTEHALFELWR